MGQGVVRLQRIDGSLVRVSLDQLSPADQRYVLGEAMAVAAA